MREPERDPELAAELAALAPLLDRIGARAPSDALVERTLRLASAELLRAPSLLPGVAVAPARLPSGFGAELFRLLAAALPAIALGAFWATWLLRQGPAWLGGWLRADLALALALGPGVAALTALGLLSASLPLFAHHRALLRIRGETA
jgi:hypothetical protein